MAKFWINLFIIIYVHQSLSEIYWTEVEHHPAWKFVNSFECGVSISDRIIGGVNALLGQFPWIVRVGYTIPGESEIDWMCGGALLTDRHVLTAAHCTQTSPDYKLSYIRMGEYNTETNPDCQLNVCAPPVQERNIKQIFVHPDFNKPAFHNDIAIIVLDVPVQLNNYVLPICLPSKEQFKEIKVGVLLTVAGWGKMNLTTEERARILQFVILPVMKPDMCDSFGRGFKLAPSEICAGAQLNKDACGGDSGGPMVKVYDTVEGPKSFVIGVVSFGPTICGIRKPGVYASVPHFLKWILDSLML